MGYLPETFTRFAEAYPAVQSAYESLAEELNAAGPLTPRERRLVKLGIAIGRHSEGAMRSHVRKALDEGIEPEAIRHAAILAISTAGFPTSMASLRWSNEVLDAQDR